MACDTLSSKVGTSRDIHRVGSIPARFADALATLVKNATQSYIAHGTLFFLKNVWEKPTHACVGEKIRKNSDSLWRFLEDVPACRHGPRTHTGFVASTHALSRAHILRSAVGHTTIFSGGLDLSDPRRAWFQLKA